MPTCAARTYTSAVPPKPPAFLRRLRIPNPLQREPDPTGKRSLSVSRRIDARPARIFAVLADPRRHPELDGSGTVQTIGPDAPTRLGPGVQFTAEMRRPIPYRVRNVVVEFEEGRRIAWAHGSGHRWRYTLEPLDDGSTLVTETFDWSTAKAPAVIERLGYPERNLPDMEATLARLEAIVLAEGAPAGGAGA